MLVGIVPTRGKLIYNALPVAAGGAVFIRPFLKWRQILYFASEFKSFGLQLLKV